MTTKPARPPRILNPVIKKTEKQQRQHLTLPQEVGEALRSATPRDKKIYCVLLREKGWTLQSIGDQLGVTREMVRLYVAQADLTDTTVARYLPLPDLPVIVTEHTVHEPIKPDSDVVAKLLELQPLAQKVRSSSPNFREEAEEYTALIAKEVDRGVPVYQLAKALGVTYSALLFRLTRYGYKPVGTGKSKAYNAIHEHNRKRG